MKLQASYFKKTFTFGFKARTSRGLMRDKTSWFIRVWDKENPAIAGIGECGPLPGLSPEAGPDFEGIIENVVKRINDFDRIVEGEEAFYFLLREVLSGDFSSLKFALETAWLDLRNGGVKRIYHNGFMEGQPIPINGLVWMGDLDFMMSQINEKVALGFRCIKLKVGGLDFDRECDILRYIRQKYFREDIVIRLDANGAFKTDDVLYKLNQLSQYNIHSIEQPLKPGLFETAELCRKSPIPLAFDEELIGITKYEDKVRLLTTLKPQFIILKPTLHGGLKECSEWISIAENLKIGWWITSALESNVGLNAICQFTANYPVTLPQGLGTGMIYENNLSAPLRVEKGTIRYDPAGVWYDSDAE
ncbi:MAG TPA: o-succinylbenzoate synthase [Ohtaekwangia sp.]|nr:o-succinylbenzoate synthase [Ohtaekwangia sp.]